MNFSRFHFLPILLLLALLFATFPITFQPNSTSSSVAASVPLPGSDIYNEDFTSTTYQSGATTAEGWGTGTVTSTRDYSVTQLDHFSTPDPVTAVEVQGRKAYIGLYDPSSIIDTVRILNISDPTNLQQLSTRSDLWSIMSVAIDGDILYTGRAYISGFARVWVYNVSTPTAPSTTDTVDTLDGNVVGLEVQGHFLYMACANPSGSFRIFDVEDPYNLNQVFSQAWINLRDLQVVGQLAYMAHSTYGIKIRNVSDPYAPSAVGSVDTPSNATDILVDGSLAYVADGDSGVQIIDVSDPTTPTIIGSYNTPGHAENLALQGATLYIADGNGGLQVVDVSDPTAPLNVTAITTLPYTYDVDLYGGDVVVAAADGVYTFRIGAGLSTLPWIGSYSGHNALDVAVQGNIAYIAAGADGLITLDVSDPMNPVLLDQDNSLLSDATSLAVQGTHCFVTSFSPSRRLVSFDVSDPTNIQPLDYISFAISPTDVFVSGDVAYIAVSLDGLYSFDISDPSSMGGLIDYVSEGYNYTSVWAQGNTVYATATDSLADTNKGLYVYDATDLSNLILTDHHSLTYLEDVVVDGDFCAVADGIYGMYFLNVTDSFGTYTLDAFYPDTNISSGVGLFGPYILAAHQAGGLYLLNASNPFNIQSLANYVTSNIAARRLTIHGDFVYLANTTSLEIFRLFKSAGATYVTGNSIARSLTVDTTDHIIKNVTLTATTSTPSGTSISWHLSANGGTTWEAVTPGVKHTFTTQGSDLCWRATLNTNRDDHSARLTSVSITYEYNDPPTVPVLTDPGTTDNDGAFSVGWSTSTDASGVVDHYLLQMSDTNTFAAILDSWTPTGTTQAVSGLSNGTYHFRVQAVDDDGATSDWSNIENIEVAIPPTTPTTPTTTPTTTPLIPGFPVGAIVAGIVLATGLTVLLRRRKIRKR